MPQLSGIADLGWDWPLSAELRALNVSGQLNIGIPLRRPGLPASITFQSGQTPAAGHARAYPPNRSWRGDPATYSGAGAHAKWRRARRRAALDRACAAGRSGHPDVVRAFGSRRRAGICRQFVVGGAIPRVRSATWLARMDLTHEGLATSAGICPAGTGPE